MKYIGVPNSVARQRWLRRATKALETANQKPPGEERLAYINTRSKVWSDLKPDLEKLSAGKCWYSEARDKVSYWQVDHYRPKSIYPWLAFDWRNFRLCGGVPNVAKLDYFPLDDETKRAKSPNDPVGNEEPLLLDPNRWGDSELLTFTANGEPACAVPNNNTAAKRVRATVSLLQLDREPLCAARREKWRQCESTLKELRRILSLRRHQDNDDAERHMNSLCREIARLFDGDAEFTSTARACARQLGDEQLVEYAKQYARRLDANEKAMAC